EETQKRLVENYETSTLYSRKIGNIYTASLYLGLVSLLENKQLAAGSKVGLFSYGSGAVGEFFTGTLQANYRDYIYNEVQANMFEKREEVSVEEYETIFEETLPIDGSTITLNTELDPAPICLSGIKAHERQYVNKLAK